MGFNNIFLPGKDKLSEYHFLKHILELYTFSGKNRTFPIYLNMIALLLFLWYSEILVFLVSWIKVVCDWITQYWSLKLRADLVPGAVQNFRPYSSPLANTLHQHMICSHVFCVIQCMCSFMNLGREHWLLKYC